VREAIGIVAAMTDDEFVAFSERAGGLDVDVLLAALNAK